MEGPLDSVKRYRTLLEPYLPKKLSFAQFAPRCDVSSPTTEALPKRRPLVLDKEKLGLLFDRARGTRLYPLSVLASATGCRRGELLALEWSDLDESTSEISVSKSLEQTKAGLRIKSTKSEQPRRFSVPEWALEVLRVHRQEQQRGRELFGLDYDDHNLVFCQPNGAYYSPDRLGARVVELMRKAGLEGVSLRHSHASSLLRNGVPIAVVSERLGHSDQNITLSIYSTRCQLTRGQPRRSGTTPWRT
jgi:integrase